MNKFLPYLIFLTLLAGCRQVATQQPNPHWSDYRKAYSLLQTQPDSAFYYFNQSAVKSHDSLQVAMAYSSMGQIQYRAGDYYGSQESLLTSLKFLGQNLKTQHNYVASNYNDLGLVRSELKDRDGALNFYRQALKYHPDSLILTRTWNNMAYEWQQKGRYEQATDLYQRLLERIHTRNEDYARTFTNLTVTKWLADRRYQAAAPLRVALSIREHLKDQWGQNSSYAHLSDYYRNFRPDSALFFARAMYTVSREIESPDNQLDALSKLIDLSPPVASKHYFSRFRRLNDSLQTARNAAKNQFALIRYNVEKAQAENLELQKDNANKKLQLIRQRIGLYGVLAVFLLVSLFSYLWYQKRRAQQELDKVNAVNETRQKTSKKVHDNLANNIYIIMKKIQHEPDLDRASLVADVEVVYQRARDISYEITQWPDERFHEQLSGSLRSFATDELKVVLVGNSIGFWNKVKDEYKIELTYILQELMINMKKHSQATNVVIKFREAGDHRIISYVDNGIGMPADLQPKNGLTNTGNRIKGIGGQITFDTQVPTGLAITITFPTR